MLYLPHDRSLKIEGGKKSEFHSVSGVKMIIPLCNGNSSLVIPLCLGIIFQVIVKKQCSKLSLKIVQH